MNEEKLKRLNIITEDKPNRLRESYLCKFDIYSEIKSFSGLDIPFIQNIWHWVNDEPRPVRCICGNSVKFNRNWKDGYRKFCSPKCAQNNTNTKEKRKITNLEKWGVDNPSKSITIKEKIEKTNIERWGFKSTFQNEEVRNRWKESVQKKWGEDHYFKTEDFKIKSKKYYLEKWGVEYPWSVEEIKEKIKKTCLTKYGVTTYLNTEDSRNLIKKVNKSRYELELSEWIKSLGLECTFSDRSIISPFSIDIFIPEFKLALEFNGLYWHSEIFKDKEYHLNKTNMCRDKGITLIHIWEDDWRNRKDIIKSLILNKLSLIKNRIQARKCDVKIIKDNLLVSKFLNNNHIQGWVRSNIVYGLFHKGELVSIMNFGWRCINGKKEYELLRFCSKINTIIIGGANKLFSKFLNDNVNIDKITTYADISMFSGLVYKSMGFDFIQHSGVNYWWVVGGVRKHRFSFNKKKLVKMGHDRSKTEVEIMHSMGNYRVWGCGQEKWIFFNRNEKN